MAASGASTTSPMRLIGSKKLRIVPFNADLAVADDQLAIQEPARRARVDYVLLAQDTRSERLRAVILAHRYLGLDHDRAVVQLRGDELHRAAVHLRSRGKRARVRVQPGECRQQRRMDIEQPAGVARHK